MQKGALSLYVFFHNHNYQGGTGKFIYNTLILYNKQLLSNMIDRKAIQPYTTVTFLAENNVWYCSFVISCS